MCFVPVEFRSKNRTIAKANDRRSFHLPPSSAAVLTIQPPQNAKAPSRRDRSDVLNVTNDLEQRCETSRVITVVRQVQQLLLVPRKSHVPIQLLHQPPIDLAIRNAVGFDDDDSEIR
jgi:hypothetical protein